MSGRRSSIAFHSNSIPLRIRFVTFSFEFYFHAAPFTFTLILPLPFIHCCNQFMNGTKAWSAVKEWWNARKEWVSGEATIEFHCHHLFSSFRSTSLINKFLLVPYIFLFRAINCFTSCMHAFHSTIFFSENENKIIL